MSPLSDLGAPRADDFSRTRADLERWRAGDEAAFESLWLRYRPGLEVLVAGKVRSSLEPAIRGRLDVDDVLQDVALVVLDHLADFEYRGPGSVMAWLAQIAQHVVQDRAAYWRAGRRHPSRQRSASDTVGVDLLASIHGGDTGVPTRAGRMERRARIAQAFAQLSDRHHTILWLRHFAGASWAEVAQEVGSPSPDAVRVEHNGKVIPALATALHARDQEDTELPQNAAE